MLNAAERPIIVAGGGVAWSGAQAEVVALAERLSIPVATSLNAKGAILETHPLSVGVVRNVFAHVRQSLRSAKPISYSSSAAIREAR